MRAVTPFGFVILYGHPTVGKPMFFSKDLNAYFGEIGHLFGLKTAGCPGKSATPI
jgi:hypothetical protein